MDEPMKLDVPEDLLMIIQRALTLYTLTGHPPSIDDLRYYLQNGYIPGNAPDWPQIIFNVEGTTKNVWYVAPGPNPTPGRVFFRSEQMLARKVLDYPDHIYYILSDEEI